MRRFFCISSTIQPDLFRRCRTLPIVNEVSPLGETFVPLSALTEGVFKSGVRGNLGGGDFQSYLVPRDEL